MHSEKRMYRHSSNGTIFLSLHQRRCWLLQLKLAETRGHLNKSTLSNLVLAGILMPSVVDLISHGRARNPLDDELKQDVWGGIFFF